MSPSTRSTVYVFPSTYTVMDWRRLLHFIGSFDLRTATEIFENMVSGILDYSWMDDALLLEGEA